MSTAAFIPVSAPQNVVVRLECGKGFDETYSLHLNNYISRDAWGTTVAQLNQTYNNTFGGCCRFTLKKIISALFILACIVCHNRTLSLPVLTFVQGLIAAGGFMKYQSYKARHSTPQLGANGVPANDVPVGKEDVPSAPLAGLSRYAGKCGCRGSLLIVAGVVGLYVSLTPISVCSL
jgi:hypothetical protein